MSEEMAVSVYCIESPIGKKYIGVSSDPESRFATHSFRPSAIGNAIRKYGKGNMLHSIMAVFDSYDEAYIFEKYCISMMNTVTPFGYNIDGGGLGGKRIHESTKEKLRKPKPRFTDDHKINIRKSKAEMTRDDHVYIHEKYSHGQSKYGIAKDLGLSWATVHRWLGKDLDGYMVYYKGVDDGR